jgi:hypothetical protein
MPNVDTLLRDHVRLQVDCIDRLYLNGYVARLQRPQNLWWFLHEHRGHPVVSPVLLKKWVDTFVGDIHAFAQRHRIPVVQFAKGARKEEVVHKHLARFKPREGVVLIGVAQEKVNGFRVYQKDKRKRRRPGQAPCFAFYRGHIAVNQYYFYLLDRDFGLCFIKFSSYPPFNVRVWINGHEWAKRQLARRRVAFEELDNGFFTCAQPELLQRTCDSLSAEHIERFFRAWLRRLPHPFTAADRRAGHRYQLSILQMEVSLTQVFDRPLHGRQFFEEVIRDNLDVGRPDRVQLLFERRLHLRGKCQTPGTFRTRVLMDGVQPSLRFDYKHTRVKQYFKLCRALRTETTFNDAYDFDVGRSLGNLPRLRTIGRHINHRLLTLERVAQHCAIASQTVERIVLPTVDDGQRAPALRWGDPRTMALFSAVCAFAFTPEGFTNQTLRQRVGALHDPGPRGYTPGRMTYDLRRLRRKGLIVRLEGTHRYQLTHLGRRVALFMAKSYARLVRPLLDRLDPSLPDDADDRIRHSWLACERAFDLVTAEAGMAA